MSDPFGPEGFKFDAEEFREAFLKANARPEFIAHKLADVIRHLMRAVASDDPARATYAASEEMKLAMDLVQRCEERLTYYNLFADAVASIQKLIPEDAEDRRYIQAAKDGVKYLVESSATDNAAKGRASRRLTEFRASIAHSDASRRGR